MAESKSRSKKKTEAQAAEDGVEKAAPVKRSRAKAAAAAAAAAAAVMVAPLEKEEVATAPLPPPTKKRAAPRSRTKAVVDDVSTGTDEPIPGADPAPAKTKSKAASKASAEQAPATTSTTTTTTTSTTDHENVILQLNIDANSATQTGSNAPCFEQEFFDYNSDLAVPDAYNQFDKNGFTSQPCAIAEADDEHLPITTPHVVVAPKTTSKKKAAAEKHHLNNGGKRVFDHLSEFMTRDDWPLTTSVSCFWCCHSFSNTPFGIPTKFSADKFHVVGCFCSLECATAYNFYSSELKHDMWESYTLINLLSRRIQYKDTVRMAPPRHALKMFGGYMDIYEFRGQSESSKVISTHTYPMVAVIQQLEEVNDTDNYNYGHRKNMFVPIDKQKLFMLETKMKLERTKPLYQNKNTLDHTMNLKVE
jgi:hypothetical protein